MRAVFAVLLLAVAATSAVAQDRAPEIVIPGKPGVPVYINGIDASYGIVEGDFGLGQPDILTPTVVYRPLIVSYPRPDVPSYHPKTGQKPGYGRLEIIPPPDRPKPPPAPTYYRSWSAGSAPGLVTDYAPYNGPAAVGIENNTYNNFGRHRHSSKPSGPSGPPGPPPKGP